MTRAANRIRLTLTSAAMIAASLGLLPGTAQAQQALGGGNRLDANLGVGSGRINAPTPVQDFRTRNLIVTGNVAGGRGFRGAVGYGAEGDFRGATGVDDLFGFRADAAWSAPAVSASPGWQQLRFGQDLGAIALRRGGGVTAGMVTDPQRPDRFEDIQVRRPLDERARVDAIVAGAGPLARVDTPMPTRPVGFTFAEEGHLLAFEVSPLRGMMVTDFNEQRMLTGLSAYDIARLRVEQQATPGRDLFAQHRTDFTSILDSGRIEQGAIETRVRAETEDPTLGLLERIARRYADRTDVLVHLDPQLISQLDEEYRDLRERLARVSPGERWRIDAERAEADRLPAEVDEEQPWQPRELDLEPAPVVETGPETTDDEDAPPRTGVGEVTPPGDLDRLFTALRHGEELDRLATEGNSRFDELMAEGEQALRTGEYFIAERRFMRALRITPGHPLAVIGAAHSQLGAGLQLPAALSIRRVLTNYPEMIDARYEAGLLPSRPRLIQVVDASELRLERTPGDEAEYGLVIAYVGHQIGDRSLVERGLSLMAEVAPDDPFVAVLRNVWLAPPEQENAAPRQGRTPAQPQSEPAAPEK